MPTMRLLQASLFLTFGLTVLQASQITVPPGSLLALSIDFSTFPNTELTTFSKTGAVLNSGLVTGANDIVEGLAVVNGNLFASDGSGEISRVNLSTGGVVPVTNVGMVGLDGFSAFNGDLIALTFASTAIQEYTTNGTLVSTINLQTLPANFSWSGLTSDGTAFYLADYANNTIDKYSLNGMFLGTIPHGIGSITALAYDASNNSLWASTNGTANEIVDLSTSGAVLSQFSTGDFHAFGLAVVPASATPEPGYAGLLLGLLTLAGAAKALKSSK